MPPSLERGWIATAITGSDNRDKSDVCARGSFGGGRQTDTQPDRIVLYILDANKKEITIQKRTIEPLLCLPSQ